MMINSAADNAAWENPSWESLREVREKTAEDRTTTNLNGTSPPKRPSPVSIVSFQAEGGKETMKGVKEGKEITEIRGKRENDKEEYDGKEPKESGRKGIFGFFQGKKDVEGGGGIFQSKSSVKEEISDVTKFGSMKVGYKGTSNKEGQPDGHGVYKYLDGSVYNGEWREGRRHGHGTYTFSNGDRYVGEWVEDYKEGQGKMRWHTGDYYDGEWKFNKREGYGKFKGADGRSYDGMYHDDCKHGLGIYRWPNGDAYDGNWNFNKKHRSGIIRYHNYDVYHGEFEDDVKCGPGTWYFKIGTKFKDPRAYPFDWTLIISKVKKVHQDLFQIIYLNLLPYVD